jgi:hypothetical protein
MTIHTSAPKIGFILRSVYTVVSFCSSDSGCGTLISFKTVKMLGATREKKCEGHLTQNKAKQKQKASKT